MTIEFAVSLLHSVGAIMGIIAFVQLIVHKVKDHDHHA